MKNHLSSKLTGHRIAVSDDLFLQDFHRVDLRAPVEFHAGTIPGAVNLPILNNEERHQVGLTYREKGQMAAIELGHRLVNGEVKRHRVSQWSDSLASHAGGVLFCFRGGLRSQTAQAWLAEVGVEVPLIAGGYKAMRRHLLKRLEELSQSLSFRILSGPTGSGKTEQLPKMGASFLDLEALAAHRGSAFGRTERAQPNQIDFENQIAIQLIRLAQRKESIWLENESRMIGKCTLPLCLYEAMQRAPKTVLEVALAERVERIFQDYIAKSRLGTEGDVSVFGEFEGAVRAIAKKLGPERSAEIIEDLNRCRLEFQNTRSLNANRIWIEKLLRWYYDPLYLRNTKRSTAGAAGNANS